MGLGFIFDIINVHLQCLLPTSYNKYEPWNPREKNRNELSEIPKNVKRKIKFLPVSTIDEVIAIALGDKIKVPAPLKTKKNIKAIKSK